MANIGTACVMSKHAGHRVQVAVQYLICTVATTNTTMVTDIEQVG